MGSTTTFGTGNVQFTIPVTAATNQPNAHIGNAYILDSSSSEEFHAHIRIYDTTNMMFMATLAASPARIAGVSGSAGVPFSFATSDRIEGNFTYEAA